MTDYKIFFQCDRVIHIGDDFMQITPHRMQYILICILKPENVST